MKKLLFSLATSVCTLFTLNAQVVINEFAYDDSGTDDREFVELFNSGLVAVDISGWSVGGRDNAGVNTFINIPAATILSPGAYYVIGQVGVANVNQVAVSFLENDAEQLELWTGASGTGSLVDGMVYEGNKGAGAATGQYGTLGAAMTTQVGGRTYWGNHNAVDLAGTPLRTLTSVSRYIDGRDNNNNGRDLGMMPATPGSANSVGSVSSFLAPNVDSLADGTIVSQMAAAGFVGGRAMTPGTVVAGLNPKAIPAPPVSTKAITVFDGSGGGNAAVSDRIFNGAINYDIVAYFDTANITVNSNVGGTLFRGSELTMFGLGSIDAFANLADLSTGGILNLGTAVSANGATGIGWYYEKIGESALGLGDVSEKLYLVNAGHGGNANVDSSSPVDWTVLATIDLSSTLSGWYRLSIALDGAGNGTASFNDGTPIAFGGVLTDVGEFYVGYRENAQLGAVGVPDFLRPATYAAVPEPSAAAIGFMGLLAILGLRRKQ
jgi:hypothetical protein